jgi:hypothetical protein
VRLTQSPSLLKVMSWKSTTNWSGIYCFRRPALLDRITHHCYIMETGNDFFRTLGALMRVSTCTKPLGCRARSLSDLWGSKREFGWARTDFAGFAGQ